MTPDPVLDGMLDILEGVPTQKPKFPNPFGGNWGNLYGQVSGTFLPNASAPIKGDNPGPNQMVASLSGGENVCNDAVALLGDVLSYDSNPASQSPYRPIPKSGSGYANSNSFTFTLLSNVGLSDPSGSRRAGPQDGAFTFQAFNENINASLEVGLGYSCDAGY